MIYLDQERLDQFFQSVANGFATTPKEVLLFFIVLALILVFLVVFYLIQRRRIHGRLYSQSAGRYAELIGRHRLSGIEVQLIEAMSEYLPQEKQKYELLTNQHLFNLCAGKLQNRMKVSESTLASLRLKLGFRLEQPEESPSSSVELPVGMPVHLMVPGRERIRGTIAAQEPDGVIIAPIAEGAALSTGTAVGVYFKNQAGIYSFPSIILDASRRELTLRHSEEIRQYQRRNYYRRRVYLSVLVSPLQGRGKTYRSVLLELGGGGASLGNPEKLFETGDLLELTFSTMSSDFRVPVKVVRTSESASVLHVQFESIAESSRDRIIGSLNRITDL
jgi:c-di-GMP-binding flagellar brake protein YcgR